MTVKLRQGIYWSDGVEFTADDVAYTVQTQIDHPGMNWSAPFIDQRRRASRCPTATRSSSVSRRRTRASTRCSRCAGTRPGSCPSTSSRRPATRSPSTTIRRSRSAPTCSQLRQGAATGRSGSCATTGSAPRSAWTGASRSVKYVVYRAAGNPEARVIEQRNHNLDVINDIAPEGMFSIMRTVQERRVLAQGFPLRPSRSDAAVGAAQHQDGAVRQQGRALGAGADDRHPRRRARLLSRRRQYRRRSPCRRRARLRTIISCRCRIG